MTIRLNWQDEPITITRLVVPRGRRSTALRSLLPQARERGLQVGDEFSEPQAGDFWLGTVPRTGFAAVSSSFIGWANRHEVFLAIGLIRAALQLNEQGKSRQVSLAAPKARLDDSDKDLLGDYSNTEYLLAHSTREQSCN